MPKKYVSFRCEEYTLLEIDRLASLIGAGRSKILNWALRDWVERNVNLIDCYEKKIKKDTIKR